MRAYVALQLDARVLSSPWTGRCFCCMRLNLKVKRINLIIIQEITINPHGFDYMKMIWQTKTRAQGCIKLS